MARAIAALALLAAACRPAAEPSAPPPSKAAEPMQAAPAAPQIVEEDDAEPPPPAPPRFAAGTQAPTGLDAESIRQFARDQGDPFGGAFDLVHAFAGDAALGSGRGKLFALLHTSEGTVECELLERAAPIAVANFVGLARGVRPFRDAESNAWITGRFYDGTIFHRVVAGFMIQGGDRTGTGTGDIGYVLPDEIASDQTFDAAGVLAMANRGPNTANSQFFISVAAAPHLVGRQTIFGHCDPKVPIAISKVPVDATKVHRPLRDVVIVRVDFERR